MTFIAAALLAVSVLAIPATAQAQEEPPACVGGYVTVISVGGPLCVNPTYLNGQWQDDPATCTNGYYQGSCVPAEYVELPPVVFEPVGYGYQPIPAVAPVVQEVERVADDTLCLIQRPC